MENSAQLTSFQEKKLNDLHVSGFTFKNKQVVLVFQTIRYPDLNDLILKFVRDNSVQEDLI